MSVAMHKHSNRQQKPLQFLWAVIKPYKYYYLAMAIAPICSGIYPVIYNYAVKLLIDLFTKADHITYHQAFWPIFWFVMAQAILDGGWRIHNYAQLKSIPYVLEDMMLKICNHVFYLPYTYFQDNLAGSIVGKIKGIGDKYYSMHMALEYKLSKPLLVTMFSGIALMYVNYKIFIFVVCFSVIYSIFAIYFFKNLAHMEQAKQHSWYHLFGTVADRVQNIMNIFAFATRTREISNISKYYQEVHNPLTIKYFKYDLIISIVLSLLYWVILIGIFVYVIHLKNIGEISIGDIAFTISITFLFAENSWHTTMEIKTFLEDIAAFSSAFTIMQAEKCTIEKENLLEFKVNNGDITFKNVEFGYDQNNLVFKDFNLHIKPGEKVGIVGTSGSGKSTLISLLLKNFKVLNGDIYLDDQSIYNVSADSLRANISLIPQDIMLFHRSIGENIAYAKEDASQLEIEQAARMANIHEFILSLPEGYSTMVGERGIKLSGGQRQRIAIARAILKNAKILILDEATSSLDSQTENQIQNSINTMLDTNNATVIAVAHRLSTIKHMDRIIVLENGQIIEDGNFSDLLLIENGKFAELWQHQANGMLV